MINKPLRLLCVDDDPMALDQLRRVLADIDAPVSAVFYGNPAEATQAQIDDPAELVISDLRMGTTTGLKVIEEMRKHAPDTIYMMLSGEADLESALLAVNEAQVFRFFTKPASGEDIQKGLLNAIREYNLARMQDIADSTLNAIERMSAAVASAGMNGEILYANPPALKLIAESGFFSVGADNQLKSTDPAQTRAFQAFLKTVSGGDDDSREPSIFRFTKSDGEYPLIVSAVYLFDTDKAASADDACFSLVFHDPARKNVVTVEDISAALNLTPSEARVVHGLVEGGSVEDAAESAGVSVSTARTYLKHVFSKTGVSRQAELVRLALLSAA